MSIEAIYNKKVTPEMLAHLTALVDECKEEAEANFGRYVKIHQKICNKIYGKQSKNTISLSMILETVCSMRGQTIEDARTRSRKRELALTRQIYMYISKKHSGRSLSHIGKYVYRDHATVLHANSLIADLMQVDIAFKEHVEAIEAKVVEADKLSVTEPVKSATTTA